ncbi:MULTISPECIES: ABC transporter ATP-binding protein [Hyphobacterium]|uniref:ABC transporter ATP-binding protein n=1 Tax=Hyphobacterium vulgare TaxID=1736751 RepID=A0ABV6ZVI7_9PROT
MTLLSLKQATLGHGQCPVLQAVDAAFSPGEFVALVGPNGAGKSTLLTALAGLNAPIAGAAALDGRSVAALPPAVRSRRIAFMPAGEQAVWPVPARTVAALGRLPHRKPLDRLSLNDEAAIEIALETTGVAHLAHRRFDTLSSGERARVLLARALATQAGILLLDEPTASLDPRHQLAIMDVLAAQAANGKLVVIAAHALDLVARYCSRVLLVEGGRVDIDGTPAEVLSEANLERVFAITAPGGAKPTDWSPI